MLKTRTTGAHRHYDCRQCGRMEIQQLNFDGRPDALLLGLVGPTDAGALKISAYPAGSGLSSSEPLLIPAIKLKRSNATMDIESSDVSSCLGLHTKSGTLPMYFERSYFYEIMAILINRLRQPEL